MASFLYRLLWSLQYRQEGCAKVASRLYSSVCWKSFGNNCAKCTFLTVFAHSALWIISGNHLKKRNIQMFTCKFPHIVRYWSKSTIINYILGEKFTAFVIIMLILKTLVFNFLNLLHMTLNYTSLQFERVYRKI